MTIKSGEFRVDDDVRKIYKAMMEKGKVGGSAGTDGSGIGGYVEGNSVTFFAGHSNLNHLTEHSFVGISPNFAHQLAQAIDDYAQNINSKLNNLTINTRQGFRGEEVIPAISRFHEAVNEVCQTYITMLKETEKSIINAVETQYRASDSNIAEQIPTNFNTQG